MRNTPLRIFPPLSDEKETEMTTDYFSLSLARHHAQAQGITRETIHAYAQSLLDATAPLTTETLEVFFLTDSDEWDGDHWVKPVGHPDSWVMIRSHMNPQDIRQALYGSTGKFTFAQIEETFGVYSVTRGYLVVATSDPGTAIDA
jgi:hypothetical protein